MKHKIFLGLLNIFLCFGLIGVSNSGKVNAQPTTPAILVDDPNPKNITYTDSTSVNLDNPLCGNDTTLVACYQLDENTGSVYLDGVPNPFNDGTTVNDPAWVPGVYNTALDFNGTSQYGYTPDENTLDLTTVVTIAAWIRPGKYDTQALVNKAVYGGRNGYELSLDADSSTNWPRKVFFRINQVSTGDDYRVNSTTEYPINGTWIHVAATYDGTDMRIYINGELEGTTSAPGVTINTNGLPLSIGAQYNGTTASLWYQGAMDDVRVYNRVLSEDEIWALFSRPPIPSSPVPTNSALVPVEGIDNHVDLQLTVNDIDTPTNLTLYFYGRKTCSTNFTLVALPDTQYYSTGNRAPFDSQTSWIVNNAAKYNITYVTHLGDIVDTNSDLTQWDVAGKLTTINGSLTMLDGAGIPYGFSLGDHDVDGGTANFNSYFGLTRFSDKPYYGGFYDPTPNIDPSDDNNNTSYSLFSVGGVDFIVIHIETGADELMRSWANNLLLANPDRRAIVVTHNLLDGTTTPAPFSKEGQDLFDAIKGNSNLFLMLGGHTTTEVRRTDEYPANSGHFIYSLRSDYQDRPNGGNGWLRLYQFIPSYNTIFVQTYSPYLNQLEEDDDSQFSLTYDMAGTACDDTPFEEIGSVSNVPSGFSPSIIWSNLPSDTHYQWYVTINDGVNLTTGPTWEFTTAEPTTVRLADFTSLSLPQGIQLSWQSAQENDLIGFNIYRSESPDGPQVQINYELIAAITPGELQGNDYIFLDTTAELGKTYYYWVEWVGNPDTEQFGPVTESLAPNHVWLPIGLK